MISNLESNFSSWIACGMRSKGEMVRRQEVAAQASNFTRASGAEADRVAAALRCLLLFLISTGILRTPSP